MKVSGMFWSVPKIVELDRNDHKLAVNNKTKVNAKRIHNTYHANRDFVDGNMGQKVRYKDMTIPFGLKQYKQVLNSKYFMTDSGERGQFENLEWYMGNDTAKATVVIFRKDIKSVKKIIIEG